MPLYINEENVITLYNPTKATWEKPVRINPIRSLVVWLDRLVFG